MRKRGTTRGLASTLIWSELRGLGWQLFVFPIGLGVLFLGMLLLPSNVSQGLDPASIDALETQVEHYFGNVEGEGRLMLALFFVQGPLLIAMFTAILGIMVVQTGVGKRIQDGELELLLSGPYSSNQVFLGLVAGSIGLTLLATASLIVIAMGGGVALLMSSGVTLSGGVLTLIVLTLVLPIPMAMWASLVAILVYLRWPDTSMNGTGPGNLVILLAVLPSIAAVVGINAVPSLDPMLGAVGLLAVTTAALGIGFVSIRRWFRADRLL